MASPFEFARYSGTSHSSFSLRAPPKPPKAPIHNPYDKFTQPQFDAWIGGITGALKRALGQEDEVETPASNLLEDADVYAEDEDEVERLAVEEGESSSEEVNDSFADFRSRRVGKGKARDPRDGPGFGKGDENEPIVIGLDSEEEEDEEEVDLRQRVEGQEVEEVEEGSEEWDEEEQSDKEVDEEMEGRSWARGESSSQARTRHEKLQEEVEYEYDDEELSDDAGEDEYETQASRQASSPVLVLSSDEEQGEAEDDSPHFYQLDKESDQEFSDEETSTSMLLAPPVSTVTQPSRYRAKEALRYQASSPVPEEADEIEEDGDDDVQPLDTDTSFPPQHVEADPEAFEIRDPWSGPRTFAEDYYSGGEIRPRPGELSADHLGPSDEGTPPGGHIRDVEDMEIFEVDGFDEADPEEVQPLEEDTSFPPSVESKDSLPTSPDYPVEIPDQWEGPRTYAEDYYAGGTVRTSHDVPPNPHHLGANDEGRTPTPSTPAAAESERPSVIYEVPEDIVQPTNEDTSFPPNVVPESLPHFVELLDPWAAPSKYAEDYYAGGEIRPSLDKNADRIGAGEDGHSPIIIESDEDDKKADKEVDVDVAANAPIDASQIEVEEQETIVASGPTQNAEELDFGIYDDMVVEDVEEVSNPQAAPSIETSDGGVEETASFVDVGIASAEALSATEAPSDAPPSQSTLPSALPSLQHPHEFGLPTPPSERLSSPAKGVAASETVETALESVESIEVIDVISDAEDAKQDEKVPEVGADGGVDFDADAVSEYPDHVEIEQVVTIVQETVVEMQTPQKTGLPDKELAVTNSETDVDSGRKVPSLDADLLDETAEVDRSAASSSSDAPPEVSMPVCADPTVPDPTSRPRTPPLSSPSSRSSFTLEPLKSSMVSGAGLNGLFTPFPAEKSGPASLAPESELLGATEMEVCSNAVVVDEEPSQVVSQPDVPTKSTAPIPEPYASPTQVAGSIPIQSQQPASELSSTTKSPSPPTEPSGLDSMKVAMHKLTGSFLLADPYPASLSTPDDINYVVEQHVLRPISWDGLAPQNNLNSVFSAEKETGWADHPTALEDQRNVENVQHNAHADSSEAMELGGLEQASAATTPTAQGISVREDDHDADADGDLDPDFAENADKAREPIPPVVPRQVDVKIPGTNGHVTTLKEVADMDKAGQSPKQISPRLPAITETSSAVPKTASSTMQQESGDERELPSILIIKKPPVVPSKSKDSSDSEELTELEETPAKPKPARSTKRKRSSSVSPLTQTTSSKLPEKRKAPSRASRASTKLSKGSEGKRTSSKSSSLSKDKGKRKEVRALPASRGSFDTRSISSRSSSGASSALRALHPGSRNTSRASSVASTAPSDYLSGTVQPSPTLNKGSSFRQQVPPPPPPPAPLLHRHSNALPHHHHHRPPPHPPQIQQARHTTTQTASSSRAVDVQPTEPAANKPSTSSHASSHRTPAYSSSPVTRSNCRYHKIGIPREEDGPNVFFLVPGCSLVDKELMDEEDIVDLGDPLPEDGKEMTPKLDAYQFDEYLIGVLRLLVGVDMLREQEVYYVPQSGPNEVPLRTPPSISASPRRTSTSAISSPVSRAPVSNAGSASTSASAVMSARRMEKPASSSVLSFSESELTEGEDSPKSKRHKPSPIEAKHTLGDMGPPDSQSISRKASIRRIMRLGRDAAEYKPGEDSHREDAQPEPLSRRKKGSKGVKRSRTSDVVRDSEVDAHKLKRQRTLPERMT
ncbi:hypothetical protein DXG03_001471 [Asterophora parasitica]|uniref:Uncharacterized protein n=1 Tax=Asterophora parasitica TaxID=117018 RepID=A0A9P7KFQ2_9AGAR|nr:hypothetical protein DXG03_001471 [Asterophora parasitica]